MTESDDLTAEQQRRARALLEQGAERLDHHTVRRLERARHAAINGEVASIRRHPGTWIGAAVAASLVAAVTLNVWMGGEHAALDVAASDLELMTAQEDLDFYQELDFYEWLDEASNEG